MTTNSPKTQKKKIVCILQREGTRKTSQQVNLSRVYACSLSYTYSRNFSLFEIISK